MRSCRPTKQYNPFIFAQVENDYEANNPKIRRLKFLQLKLSMDTAFYQMVEGRYVKSFEYTKLGSPPTKDWVLAQLDNELKRQGGINLKIKYLQGFIFYSYDYFEYPFSEAEKVRVIGGFLYYNSFTSSRNSLALSKS